MVGFHATAATHDIRLNDGELAEAAWVDRAQIAAGDIVLPPRMSVAYRLIEDWFDRQGKPTLASLNLPSPPFRLPRPVDRSG